MLGIGRFHPVYSDVEEINSAGRKEGNDPHQIKRAKEFSAFPDPA
jgi:hypothetical protein